MLDLSEQSLREILRTAASQRPEDEHLRRAAETQLKEWESAPGFYSLLQNAYMDMHEDLGVRFIAITLFKNGIDRYWRRSAPRSLNEEERSTIRSKLFDNISGLEDLLARQHAFAVARIVRADFPMVWKSPLKDIASLVEQAQLEGDAVKVMRLLGILDQSIKALCMVKAGRTRMALIQQAPEVFEYISSIYDYYIELGVNNQNSSYLMVSLRCLKICRRLMIEGFESPQKYAPVVTFFSKLGPQFTFFLNSCSQGSHQNTELFETHARNLGKLFLELADRNPTAFLQLPGAFDIIKCYLSFLNAKSSILHDADADVTFLEKIALQGLHLFKSCLTIIRSSGNKTIKYRTVEQREETKNAVANLGTNIFTNEIVTQMADLLLFSYMRLRPLDLDLWSHDPEEFLEKSSGENWEYDLTMCSEKVYQDLVFNFKDDLVNRLLSSVEKVSRKERDRDILICDSVYTGFLRCSSILQEHVNFDDLVDSVFAPQVMDGDGRAENVVLRRRIAMIMGEWVTVKSDPSRRDSIYRVLVSLLSSENPLNDLVVQVSAIQAFRYCADEWEFQPGSLIPYLEIILSTIMGLIDKVSHVETKIMLLNCLAVIIERVGEPLRPYTSEIIRVLPVIWDSSGEDFLLKSAVIQTLSSLIGLLGTDSNQLYNLSIPIISASVSPKSPLFSFIYEDALPLWRAVVENTSEPTQQILQLLPLTIDLVDSATESLREIFEIINEYLLLDFPSTAKMCLSQLAPKFASFMTKLKIDDNTYLCKLLTIVVMFADTSVVAEILFSSGIVQGFLEAISNDQESSTINQVQYLTILSRICISNSPLVLEYFSQMDPQGTKLVALVDTWFDRFDNMGHAKQRKLNCMGITVLLRHHEGLLEKSFQQLVAMWTSVLDEVQEDNGDSPVYYDNDEIQVEGEQLTLGMFRKKKLISADPVHTVPLKPFVHNELKTMQQQFGGAVGFEDRYLAPLDSSLRDLLAVVLQ